MSGDGTLHNSSGVYRPRVVGVMANMPIQKLNLSAENLTEEFDRFTNNVETEFRKRLQDLDEQQLADLWALYLPEEAYKIIEDAPPEIRISRKNMREMIMTHEVNKREEERRSRAAPALCTRSKNQGKSSSD